MPWPPAEFVVYMHRAGKAMTGQLHGRALTYRFASLLEHGTAEPVHGCPAKPCRGEFPGLAEWCRGHTAAQLRVHIETADDEVFAARLRRAERLHEWVLRWVGWRRRRGDLIVQRRKARWVNVRTR